MKDVKIADYLWFQEGPGVRNTQYTTSGVKLINVANLVDGNVDLSTSDRYISEEEAYGKYNHFLADDGDFVIASSGIKIDYFDKKMGFIKKEHLPLCMNTSCIRFKVLDTNNLEIKYFMYYLKSNSFKKQLSNQITGSAQLNFGPSHLKKMTFPLIELKEQKRIIERLDKTQNIINETKSLLSKYDTLIKSRFIEMFGENPIDNGKWDVRSLDNLCTVTSSKRIYAEEQSSCGVPFLRISDLVSRINGFPTNELFIPNKKFKEFREKSLVPVVDDILITSRGTLGLCYIITPDDEFYFQDGMITWLAFENHNEILSIFIDWLFKTILKMKIDNETNGATVKYISISDLKNLKIPVPPLSLQNQFAAFVHQIDKSKFAVQKSLEKTETLYKSLMQEYFG